MSDIVNHTRADGANWLNKAAALCNLRTHQCYPTWQESSLSALMLRLRPFPPLKHDTGDKRHFVCSKNSSTDSLPRDEQQIVLMRKLRKYDERAKQVLLQYSCTVTTSTGKIQWYGHSPALSLGPWISIGASFVYKHCEVTNNYFNLNICIFIYF